VELDDRPSSANYSDSPNATDFKKITEKKIREIFCEIFFGYLGSTSNLESVCENLDGIGLLFWEEIENAETVVKGLAKL
jgi:hypothetical protein